MKKRQAIIQAATVLFGTIGFDATTTLEIANEASVTEPLLYYYFKGKDELFTHCLELAFKDYFSHLDILPKNTSPEFQKIANLINLHFKVVDEMPEQMRLIVATCPAKLNDPQDICRKKYTEARKCLSNYILGCLKNGINKGEFNKLSVPETTHMPL